MAVKTTSPVVSPKYKGLPLNNELTKELAPINYVKKYEPILDKSQSYNDLL
jgi:hypothetical protein